MANLQGQFQSALESADQFGNFMLKLDEMSYSSREIVDGLIAGLLAASRGVVFAGYSPHWRDNAAATIPDWAPALDRRMGLDGTRYVMSPEDSVAPDVRGFWVDGSFFDNEAIPGTSRTQYRPGVPVVRLSPSELTCVALGRFATGFVGFASDLARRKGVHRQALLAADDMIRREPDLLCLLYQDTSWLAFRGAAAALHEALRAAQHAFLEARAIS